MIRGVGPGSLPPGVAAEIGAGRREAPRDRSAGQPIEQWRFDGVRAEYQSILKRSGDNPAVEEALRCRLARVTRHEQAAAAAREFQEVLDRTRRRDAEVDRLERRLAAVDRYRTVTYHAIGFVQPSSRLLDGRKLHALIARDGRTIAYLDLPPGLDVEAIGTRRVGVRGAVHYNQELGTRLITVRDLEPVGRASVIGNPPEILKRPEAGRPITQTDEAIARGSRAPRRRRTQHVPHLRVDVGGDQDDRLPVQGHHDGRAATS